MLISQVQSDSDSLRFSSALWSGRSPSQGSGPASQACWSPVPVLTSDRDVFTFHSSPDQQTFMSDRDLLSDGIEKRFWRLIRIFSLFLKGFLSLGLNRRTGHSSLSRLFTLSSLGGERQNTNTKARSRGKQAAITGETPKINYTAPPANSLAFLCNQLHRRAWTARGSLRKKREVNKTYTEIGKTKDGTQTYNYAVIYKHWKNERSCGCIENGQSSFYQIRD